jgi:hypothetical protein
VWCSHFLVVKIHIISPPPPAWASLLNSPKLQKLLGHWFSKIFGLWYFFFIWKIQNFQKFKELCFDFIFIDFVWYFDFLIFWSCENPSRVEKTFIFLIQSILFSNGGLLHGEKKY